MSEKIDHPFYVEIMSRGCYTSDRQETLAEAEAYARGLAYRYGEDYIVFKAAAIARKPEAVNDVKVEAVK